MDETSISQGMFHRYVRVQLSGEVNMQNIRIVELRANLTETEVKFIQDHYEELAAEHGMPDDA